MLGLTQTPFLEIGYSSFGIVGVLLISELFFVFIQETKAKSKHINTNVNTTHTFRVTLS